MPVLRSKHFEQIMVGATLGHGINALWARVRRGSGRMGATHKDQPIDLPTPRFEVFTKKEGGHPDTDIVWLFILKRFNDADSGSGGITYRDIPAQPDRTTVQEATQWGSHQKGI